MHNTAITATNTCTTISTNNSSYSMSCIPLHMFSFYKRIIAVSTLHNFCSVLSSQSMLLKSISIIGSYFWFLDTYVQGLTSHWSTKRKSWLDNLINECKAVGNKQLTELTSNRQFHHPELCIIVLPQFQTWCWLMIATLQGNM